LDISPEHFFFFIWVWAYVHLHDLCAEEVLVFFVQALLVDKLEDGWQVLRAWRLVHWRNTIKKLSSVEVLDVEVIDVKFSDLLV